jgi:plastocyanin
VRRPRDEEDSEMRAKATLGTIGMVSLIGAAACGGGGGASTGTGGATGTGGTGTSSVNGCSASTAEDHTKENPVMISFGGAVGESYSPKCAKVAKGSGVMFMGDLVAHPLSGGVDGKADATSPIKETKTGMMVMFDNLPAGTFGFFCENHDAAGMHGAIFVQ